MSTEPDAAMVERRARIFRFGDYPDKGDWSVTREEFIAANGESGEVPIGFDPINLKHYEGKVSALDGMTGTAEFTVEGDEVHAVTRMPAWLDRVREQLGLKVSSVLGRAGKELRKIDLVDRPHIADAVFFADGHGDVAMFDDDEPAPAVEFAGHDDGGHDVAQMHHEIAAACMPGLCSPSGASKVHFAKEAESERGLRLVHDHAVHHGAYCPGMPNHHGEVGMTAEEIEEMQAENDRFRREAEEAKKTVTFSEDEVKALRDRTARLEAEAANREAVSFAESVTKGPHARAYPAERPAIVAAYKRAAALDARLGETVTFTDDGKAVEGSYVDAFKADFKLRKEIGVQGEKVVAFELGEEPDTAGAAADKARAEARQKANAEYARSL